MALLLSDCPLGRSCPGCPRDAQGRPSEGRKRVISLLTVSRWFRSSMDSAVFISNTSLKPGNIWKLWKPWAKTLKFRTGWGWWTWAQADWCGRFETKMGINNDKRPKWGFSMIFLAGLKYVESFTRFGMIGSKLTRFFKGVETKKQEELTNQISSSDSSAAGLMD